MAEPAGLALAGLGVLSLLLFRRQRKQVSLVLCCPVPGSRSGFFHLKSLFNFVKSFLDKADA